MSTWVGNGYRIRSDISILDFVRTFDAAFSRVRDHVVTCALAELIAEIEDNDGSPDKRVAWLKFITNDQVKFDRIDTREDRPVLGIARDVLSSLNEALRAPVAYRLPTFDVNLTIRFYSDPANPGEQYATVHTEKSEYVDVWKSLDGVEEYFYWNGTEHPETSTYREWKHRGETWNSIIGYDALGLNSVAWELSTVSIRLMDVDEDELAACIADYRLKRDSERILALDLLKEYGISDDDDDDNGDPTSELVPL
jgi:hypothetical protein